MTLKQAHKYINEGYKTPVDMDLEKFFDTVNHDILIHLISEKIKDTRVLKLNKNWRITWFTSNTSTTQSIR